MKTTLKILILISTILTSSIVAQDTTKTQTSLIIKTDIFMPIYSLATNYKAGSLTVEFGVKRRHSLQITGLVSNLIGTTQQYKSTQIIPAYKYFLSNKKPYTGFYTGLYIKGDQLTSISDYRQFSEPSYLEYKTTSMGGGLLFGYQNYIKKRIVVDILLGIGARQILNREIVKIENITFDVNKKTYLDALFALNIGYKF